MPRASRWVVAALLMGAASAADQGPGQGDGSELIAMINSYRASTAECDGGPAGATTALRADGRLALLEVGPTTDPLSATRGAGYAPAKVQIINLSGPEDPGSAMRLLVERYCHVLRDEGFDDIGVAHDGTSWQVVLARALIDPDLPEWHEAGEEVVGEINLARSRSRLCGSVRHEAASPLRWNEQLAQAALEHARDMAARNYFSHVSDDGTTLSQRVDQAGFSWTHIGENIAAGSGSPAHAVAGWLDSPGHCATLMNPVFIETGAAYAIGEDSDAVIYWVQVFATPQ